MANYRNSLLLATASGLAAAGNTEAPAASLDNSVINWTGWYVGLNAALTQHKASATDVNGWGAGGLPPASYVMPFFSSRETQLGIGGQAGYNWQYGNFVLGGEADIDWIGAKTTFSPAGPGFPSCGPCAVSATNELTWMATFRARAGFSFNNAWILARPDSLWHKSMTIGDTDSLGQ